MLNEQDAVISDIDKKIGDVRTESIDISFGEVINLKQNKEVVIDPEYQRLFRWTQAQKSRLVESILLELPIPPIFFIENQDGTLELIDGLQRISTMIQFIDASVINHEPLELSGCDIIESLNGLTFERLPLALRLRLKRAGVRAVIIKRQSASFLRYEMFKRLNTGGSLLSPQELRNCSARIFGQVGIDFYDFLMRLAGDPAFVNVTEPMADADKEQRGREELVLRFFAARYGQELYAGNVREWLDAFMENVLLGKFSFDKSSWEREFVTVFAQINRALGPSAFCKFMNGAPTGGLAPAHFEAITVAFARHIDKVALTDADEISSSVNQAKQTTRFREFVGPGANNKTKLRGRIDVIAQALAG